MSFELKINGEQRLVDAPASASLLSVIRDDLGLTGTRFGCGNGACGACCVLADGAAVPACMLSVEETKGKAIVTVEGLERNGVLHPIQRCFLEEDAMQCGYCTSGMLIAAVALLGRKPKPTEDDVREALDPHLCRCGVYARAIRAVLKAAS